MSKTWEIRISNYTDQDITWLNTIKDEISRMVISKEVGELGTPHLQGKITFRRKYRLTALKKLHKSAHWDETKANADSLYAMKVDSEVIFNVNNTKQGQRNDIHEYVEAIKAGKRDRELIDEFPAQFAKIQRTDKMRLIIDKEATRAFRNVEVIVHWGKTGTGKTRIPYDLGAYKFDDWDNLWWDMYEGEPIIILDEFYGQVKPTWLLNVLDGYQLKLKIKNSFTWAKWTKVYITSNEHPDHWYKSEKIPEEVRNAIRRRITQIIHFENFGTGTGTEVSKGKTDFTHFSENDIYEPDVALGPGLSPARSSAAEYDDIGSIM